MSSSKFVLFSNSEPMPARRIELVAMPMIRLLSAVSGMLLFAAILAPADAYETGPVADGGSIEGKVVYSGIVGTRKIIPTKDNDTCGGVREDPLIRVGADKAVEGAVVYLVNVAKGKAWPTAGKKPELDNVKCRFVPEVQVIAAGGLDVVNKDPVLHNTHGYYGRRTAFNTALPNQGQQIPVDLTRAGTVRVDCDAHGWMEGWIYVRDNPYFAITGPDGTFKIADVPPGEYDLVAVQSFTGPNPQKVKVDAGKPTTLSIELKKKAGPT